MSRAKEGEILKLSVDSVIWVVTDEEIPFSHGLLPNNTRIFLHSEWSIKSQALIAS